MKRHLTIGKIDTIELQGLWYSFNVMDETLIKKTCKNFKDSIDRYYDGKAWFATLARHSVDCICAINVWRVWGVLSIGGFILL